MIRSPPVDPAREADRRARRGEPERVIDQVVDGLADLVRIHIRGEVGWRVYLAGDTGLARAGRCLLCAADQQQPHAGSLQSRGLPVLVAAGEEEQLLGDAGQPGGLLGGMRHRLSQFLAAPAGTAGQLELAAQHGERRAQLMAGIGDQRALPGERTLEAG